MKLKKPTNYHQINLLMVWSLVIGIAFFVIFLYFVFFIEFDILRNPNIITDMHLRIVLLIIALFLSIEVVHIINRMMARHINLTYQARFHHLANIASYQESKNKFSFTVKKYDHIVLFLHSFSSSTHEFRFMSPYLRDNDICYYAPNLLGFGLDNTLLLNNTRRNDWYREALDTFDFLSSIAHKVSVVGHSLGGLLAGYIAANRDVDKLILVAPGFYLHQKYLIHKKILTMPILSTLYITLFPYLPKSINKERGYIADVLDEQTSNDMFYYLALPVTSVRELFRMQDEVYPEKMKANKIVLIYGQYEQTIDMHQLIDTLTNHEIDHSVHCLERSAHNPLEDFDRDDCCKLITDILLDKAPHTTK